MVHVSLGLRTVNVIIKNW